MTSGIFGLIITAVATFLFGILGADLETRKKNSMIAAVIFLVVGMSLSAWNLYVQNEKIILAENKINSSMFAFQIIAKVHKSRPESLDDIKSIFPNDINCVISDKDYNSMRIKLERSIRDVPGTRGWGFTEIIYDSQIFSTGQNKEFPYEYKWDLNNKEFELLWPPAEWPENENIYYSITFTLYVNGQRIIFQQGDDKDEFKKYRKITFETESIAKKPD